MTAQDMKLKRILGFTTNNRNSFLVQPNTGDLIYIAGCVVVILNPLTKTQKHLISNSKQNLTTIAITSDGSFLAAADCGVQSIIYVWDLASMKLVVKFGAHNVDTSCMSFSTNGQILVSFGSQQDMALNVWDWRKQMRLASHKVATKIRAISFSSDNSYFVTVGDAYAKFWYLQYNNTTNLNTNDSGTDVNSSTLSTDSSISISCRSAILGEQKRKNFCDVKCGRGFMSDATFCITKDGLLCEFNKRRLLHKWVDLRTSAAICLAISENTIVIGCANGVARCFNTTELRFLKNLPRPHCLGLDITKLGQQLKSYSHAGAQSTTNNQTLTTYPNVIAIGLYERLNTISYVLNDHSIYVWNLSDPSGKVVKNYSALYHSSCIWGIDTYPGSITNPLLPMGSFITCSSDDTIRVWHPNVFNSKLAFGGDKKKRNRTDLAQHDTLNGSGAASHKKPSLYDSNPFSNELCKIVFTDSAHRFLCDLDDPVKTDLNYDSTEGLRCLKISPSGKQVAMGNRSGAIRVFDFELDTEIKNIAAHDAEVLCLEYSDPRNFSGYCYLASSSRDKLIHIFDAADDYTFLQTIDDHLSSITAIRFVNNRASDCLQLISCGADQRIIFRNGMKGRDGQLNFATDQHIEGKTTFYDMDVDSESSCLITACQDRMIRLFNVAQVRYQSGFKGSVADEGTLIKIALDPSCTFLAASSTNKSISVYDYQRGECLASVVYGLSDLITDMKFSQDGRHLMACSGDGCIFIWKSPAEIANAIGGHGLSLAHLSLSSCSLGSLNSKQIDLELTDKLERKQQDKNLKSLPDWARQQMLDEVDRNKSTRPAGSSEGSLGFNQRSSRGINEHGSPNNSPGESSREREVASRMQENSLNPQLHYQVQEAAALADDYDDYIANANTGYATIRSDRGENFAKTGMGKGGSTVHMEQCDAISSSSDNQTRHLPGDSLPRNLDHLSKLAKAKLFQSRENLERITSREKFLNEGLAHEGLGQVRRGTAKARINGGVGGISSLSGQFNTKLIADDARKDMGADEAGSGLSQPMAHYALPVRSTSNLYCQRLNNNNNNNFAGNIGSSRGDGICPSSSSDEAELSMNGDYKHEIISSQFSNRASRPITPPKPSLHRQIRRNSASNHLDRNEDSSSLGRSGAQAAFNRPLANTSPSHGGGGGGIKVGHRRFHSNTAGYGLAGTNMRTSRSECNLLSPLDQSQQQDEQTELELELRQQNLQIDESTSHQLEGAQASASRRQLAADNLIYCTKLDLAKLDPASAPLNQELCQYVVDELQTLSKYATRFHQRLLASGNRGLSNMVARGVQNSMDILSIVPPRSVHQHKFQSQVNLSPVSMLSRRKQPPLRRPASSNSVLAPGAADATATTFTLPTKHAEGSNKKTTTTTTTATTTCPRMFGTTRMCDSSAKRGVNDPDAPVPSSNNDYADGLVEKSLMSSAAAHDYGRPMNSSPTEELCASAGGSSFGETNPATNDATGEGRRQASARSVAASIASGGQASKNNQLNLDQVLEAYSDRLFRMVQERMTAAEQPLAAANSTTAPARRPPDGAAIAGNGNDNFGNAMAATDRSTFVDNQATAATTPR